MTIEETKLKKLILKIIKENNGAVGTHIVFSLYDVVGSQGKISRMVWRLVDLGLIEFDLNRVFKITIEGERQMTKKTNRSEAARKAHETRRALAEKRSSAARKAWETRRAMEHKDTTSDLPKVSKRACETRRVNKETTQETSDTVRSTAAKKAWETRRARAIFEKRSEAARKAWRTRRANAIVCRGRSR